MNCEVEKTLKDLFNKFSNKYFFNKLENVHVSWSDKMTLATGKTCLPFSCKSRYKIKLSRPILSQRPFEDTINTLLHEMIHVFLHITKGIGRKDGHGNDFKDLMRNINRKEGTQIKTCHNFLKEVNKFRIHVYKCDGPCQWRPPFYGIIRRAVKRPPGPKDMWWERHARDCGGAFVKIQSGNNSNESSPNEGPYNCTSKSKAVTIVNKHKDRKKVESWSPRSNLVRGNVNIKYKTEIAKFRVFLQKYLNRYALYMQSQGFTTTSQVRKLSQRTNACTKLPVAKYIQRLHEYRNGRTDSVKNASKTVFPCSENYIKKGISLLSGNKEMSNTTEDCESSAGFPADVHSFDLPSRSSGTTSSSWDEDDDNWIFMSVACPLCNRSVITAELNIHMSFCKDIFPHGQATETNKITYASLPEKGDISAALTSANGKLCPLCQITVSSSSYNEHVDKCYKPFEGDFW